jgi:hypothetical protein
LGTPPNPFVGPANGFRWLFCSFLLLLGATGAVACADASGDAAESTDQHLESNASPECSRISGSLAIAEGTFSFSGPCGGGDAFVMVAVIASGQRAEVRSDPAVPYAGVDMETLKQRLRTFVVEKRAVLGQAQVLKVAVVESVLRRAAITTDANEKTKAIDDATRRLVAIVMSS